MLIPFLLILIQIGWHYPESHMPNQFWSLTIMFLIGSGFFVAGDDR